MTAASRPGPEGVDESQAAGGFIARRLRVAGVLIVVGILTEALSLLWNHPLSFLAFVGIGGLAIAAGIVVYLLALVSPRQK